MKTLLLPAALLLTTAPAWGQMQPPPPTEAEKRAAAKAAQESGAEQAEPFKGANVILIHTTDSAGVVYKKLAALLLGAGYTIDRSDKELLFINTKPRRTTKLNIIHILTASIVSAPSGTTIRINDLFSITSITTPALVTSGETETTYRGMTGSPYMVCWDEMQRVASLCPGARLGYANQH